MKLNKKKLLDIDNLLYDRVFFWCVLGLVLIGFVIVSSGSIAIGMRLFNDPYYFIKREFFYYSITFLIALIVLRIPIVIWKNYSIIMLFFSYLMLLIPLILNHSINGASRWITWGVLCIQPSELSKLSFICYLSNYLVRKSKEIYFSFWSVCKPIIIMTLLTSILLIQPDFGSVIVFFITTLFILFIFDVKLWQLIVIFIFHMFFMIIFVTFKPYCMKRILVFWDPWKDQFSSGYQLTQSLVAFGRGGYFGQGLGNSIQKLEYLPESHTDFVFSILAEELGCCGSILILLMLFFIVFRAIVIGYRALYVNQKFAGTLGCSIGVWFASQIFINIGSVSGMLPTKGLTLPFISYGGSSFLITVISGILLLRIDFETRLIRKHAILKSS